MAEPLADQLDDFIFGDLDEFAGPPAEWADSAPGDINHADLLAGALRRAWKERASVDNLCDERRADIDRWQKRKTEAMSLRIDFLERCLENYLRASGKRKVEFTSGLVAKITKARSHIEVREPAVLEAWCALLSEDLLDKLMPLPEVTRKPDKRAIAQVLKARDGSFTNLADTDEFPLYYEGEEVPGVVAVIPAQDPFKISLSGVEEADSDD
jgi:hypothetical protein